jgi:hypothetical protein
VLAIVNNSSRTIAAEEADLSSSGENLLLPHCQHVIERIVADAPPAKYELINNGPHCMIGILAGICTLPSM